MESWETCTFALKPKQHFALSFLHVSGHAQLWWDPGGQWPNGGGCWDHSTWPVIYPFWGGGRGKHLSILALRALHSAAGWAHWDCSYSFPGCLNSNIPSEVCPLAVFSLIVSWSLPGVQKKQHNLHILGDVALFVPKESPSQGCTALPGATCYLLLPCQWKFRGCISAALKFCLLYSFWLLGVILITSLSFGRGEKTVNLT